MEFSSLNIPLAGTQLIDASAGTGKTYTITDLFLRFILEKNLTADQILIVTFTEAATEELRERIRKRLRKAASVFSGLAEPDKKDSTLCNLLKNHPDRASAAKCLRNAISNFDDAAIFTIHSFCLQMLRDNAFESGALFNTELITSQDNIILETVEDFWRKHFYQSSPLFISYIAGQNIHPDSLLNLITGLINTPLLKIIPETSDPGTKADEDSFAKHFHDISKTWPDVKQEVETLLMSHSGLNRNKYRVSSIPGWISSLDSYLTAGSASLNLPDKFEKFTTSALSDAAKQKHPPEHAFFNLCGEFLKKATHLQNLFDTRLLFLKKTSIDFAKTELERKKTDQNVQYFDDLLFKLYRALKSTSGDKLAENIRRKFKAALIDEFQDTDPVQYEIFRKIFEHKDVVLILIGDPKQAIYSFRSADVFTYMKAAASVKSKHEIKKNWRSESELIHAVNALFSNHDNPFLYKEIAFNETVPAESNKEPLLIDKNREAPFHMWFFPADKEAEKKPGANKSDAFQLIAGAVANETARLLNKAQRGRAQIGSRNLQTGDIAVLVRTHAQAMLIQKEMARRSVPCILHNTGYVFESAEAMDIYHMLDAISSPGNERLIAAAMATDIMGISGRQIYSIRENQKEWESWIIKFRNYHDIWNRDGFFRMFRLLILKEGIKKRLISLSEGERRLTNLLHLSEILHKHSAETNSGMQGLVKWLAEQISPDTQKSDEHMLRLETDQDAVQIVTMHKCKGLEYPIVFCPFTWTSVQDKNDRALFHDADNELSLDLGSPALDANRQCASEENLAENMRLLYVAVTRAINRCYLIWGGFKGADTSATACLFHNPKQLSSRDAVQNTSEYFMRLSDDDILNRLREYESFSGGSIAVSKISEETTVCHNRKTISLQPLISRKPGQAIAREWHMTSFSSLVSDQTYDPGPLKSDEFYYLSEEENNERERVSEIISLPPGPKTGTMLHDMLEHFDFTNPATQSMEKLISDKLMEYDFDEKWQPAVFTMLKNVFEVRLDSDNTAFTLSEIEDNNRVAELGFYFPLKKISRKMLQNIFSEHTDCGLSKDFPSQIGNLNFSPVKGFMKGYIDLVFQHNSRFYLVDWKSNLLGTSPSDYKQENLRSIMEHDFYILQYHLYALAIHQYLAGRISNYSYEKHFGGVYYIFLRGISPSRGPEYGIYRDRPAKKLIQKLKKQLIQ